MARVRGHRFHRALVFVEAEVVGPLRLPPEDLVELLVEAAGAFPKLRGPLGLAEQVVDLRHPQHGVKGVALQLTEGDRRLGNRAVGMANRIPGILPALIEDAVAGAAEILLESVAVAIA